jgi:hypothetical protein
MGHPRMTLVAQDLEKSYGAGPRRQPILQGISLRGEYGAGSEASENSGTL